MTHRFRIRTLGPLEIERAGQVLPLGSPSQRRLLTALVIANGATVSSERLIDVLWGERPPPEARNSLQSHVARLRSALDDPGVVITRPPGYALDPDRVEVDATDFATDVEAARRALADDPATAVRRLAAALGRWRGDAYAEFADGLAHDEASRLGQLRVEARRLVAEAQLRSGDVTTAIDGFARLVAAEPLREDVVLSWAGALATAGRTADALAALHAFRSRLADELGLDPSTAFDALEQQVLRGELVDPSHTIARRTPPVEVVQAPVVPPPDVRTPTVGREQDRAGALAALASARLVTLVGPGGVGKTRLATVVVRDAVAATDAVVAWVDLARATDRVDVLTGLIDALGVVGVDPSDAAATAAALGRFRGIVVLDNCEHVLDAVASVVDRALAGHGELQLLATSRERLDVDGERVVTVAPLPVPSPEAATASDPVVQLFGDRIVAVGGRGVAPALAAKVAAAVDGLPLGIELAAARAATLPVEDLLARLTSHLDVLAGTGRRRGDRQRTLTSVIAWSYDLLPERDRVAFQRLAVFASSFRLADAEQVCSTDALPATEVADALARLVERSMVTAQGDGRYRLLEPLRLFATDALGRSADAGDAQRAHRELMLGLADRADGEVTGPGEVAIVAEVEAALPDLRAVHARALAAGDLATVAALAGRLYRFAYLQGRFAVLTWGAALTDHKAGKAAQVAPDDRWRAVAAAATAASWRGRVEEAARLTDLYADLLDEGSSVAVWSRVMLAETLGDVALGRGELAAAGAAYERNRTFAAALGHDGLLSMATSSLAVVRAFEQRFDDAVTLAREASALAARSGAPSSRSLAAYALGEAVAEQDPDAALEAFDRAITQATMVGARFFEGIARTADVALRGRHGDPTEALQRYRRALLVWRDAGVDAFAATTLRNLVILLVRIGEDSAAVTLHTALAEVAPNRSFGAEERRLRAAIAAATERLGAPAAAEARRRASDLVGSDAVVRFGSSAIETVLAG